MILGCDCIWYCDSVYGLLIGYSMDGLYFNISIVLI